MDNIPVIWAQMLVSHCTQKRARSQPYVEEGFDKFGAERHIYLQSHWGSGVIFTSATLHLD